MRLGDVLSLIAAVTWACSVILLRRCANLGPTAVNLFKSCLALLLFTITLFALGHSFDWHRSTVEWLQLLLSGFLGIAVADTLYLTALARIPASLIAVLECAYAPSVVFLSVVALGETLNERFVIGAVLIVAGVLLAVKEPDTISLKAQNLREHRIGIALAVLAVMLMAAGVVLAKPVLDRSNLIEVTVVRLAAGVLGQLFWVALRSDRKEVFSIFIPGPHFRRLIPASLMATYIGMLLWLGGVKHTTASAAATLNQLTVIITLLFARIFLKEQLTRGRILGGLVSGAGAILIVSS